MKNDILGTEKKFKIGEKNIEIKIGTIDKAAKTSMYFEFGIWITPLQDDLITTCKKIEFGYRRMVKDLIKDNLGTVKNTLFNLEYSYSPQTTGVGLTTYVRFEIMVLFNDGDSWDPYDQRFVEMGEDMLTWLDSRDYFEYQKFRKTRKEKEA